MTEIRVHLPDDMLGKLAKAADAAGMTPEELASRLVSAELFDPADFDWANGDPSESLPPLNVNEPTHAWDEVKTQLRIQRAAARPPLTRPLTRS